MSWIIEPMYYLSYEQALNNAELVFSLFNASNLKLTKEAICGILGNMWRESHVNPNMSEEGGGTTPAGAGAGLVQWTPATELTKHMTSGDTWNDGNFQMRVLIAELSPENVNNGGSSYGQWYDVGEFTYAKFVKSTDVAWATECFMRCYERPGILHLEERIEYANKFFTDITGDVTGGDGYQLAVLPIHYIHVTQSEFTPNFSHAGTEAVDMVGSHTRYPLYAPCDIVCTGVDRTEAFVNWTSQKEVRCVDGTISFINFHIGHDDTHTQYNVGDTFKKGELFGHTGNSGHSFGDHLHIEVGKHGFEGMWSGGGLPNPAKLWDVFSSCDNVTKETFPIIEAGGIPWKCELNFVDGDGGGIPPDNGGGDSEDDYITLLLCDALNGWKW